MRMRVLMCVGVYRRHKTPGIKKASIRVMRGKDGFLAAQRTEREPGCIVQCSRRAAVLPGGQRQCAGGYSSHRGMPGYGGNTQIYMLVAVEGHTADWNAGS